MATATVESSTRQRLLQAAAEVFAEVGYRRATFRAICQRAGANNAAINYHFRDKELLYLEVIERAVAEEDGLPSRAESDPALPPVEQLRVFIRSILTRLLAGDAPSRLVKIFSHEMIEPTAGLDVLIQKVVQPLNARLCHLVRQMVGAGPSERQIADCSRSIMAQCHLFDHARVLLARLGEYTVYDAATIEHLVEHITQFSLEGIRGLGGHEPSA